MEPLVGSSSPVRIFMKVDLPAPLGPVTAYRRPAIKVQVTSSKRTRGPKRMEMLFTASITFQLYRRFCGELSGDKQRLEKDNAETRSAQKCAKVTTTPIVASGIRV